MSNLWTPADLPALVAWYSADNPDNVLVSGRLDTISDKSGSGAHLRPVGGSASKRAALFPAALGGLPAWGYESAAQAQFWTSNSRLMQAGNAARGLSLVAVAAPFVTHSTPPGSIVMLSHGASETAGRIQVATGYVATGAIYGSGRRLDTDSNKTYSNLQNAGVGWRIISSSNDYLANSGDLYIDGTLSARETALQTAGHTITTDSRRFWSGATSTTSGNPYLGQTAEIIVHADALSDADRQRLEGYLAHKYSKTTDLPADHPYRTAPPVADFYRGLREPAVSAWAWITETSQGVRSYAQDADVLRRPASTTKFLSTLTARDWVTDGLLDATVTVSSADIVGGSTMSLQSGDVVTYRDLLYGMMLPSGNDAAACLGRNVGNLIAAAQGGTGGLSRFIAAMNAKLAALGGSAGATFVDASGLSVDNVCTPADMAKVIWAFGADPVLRSIGATMSYTAQVTGTNARSLPLAHIAADYVAALPEMQTIKTGTLRPSGANALKSASACLGMLWRDDAGENRVTVVFGAVSDPARYEDMRTLLDFEIALAAIPPVTARRRNRLALLVA